MTKPVKELSPMAIFLRQRRQALSLTLNEAAYKAGIGSATLSHLETGVRHNCTLSTMKRLCALYQFDPAVWFK